jgi:hypothetical protein
MAKATCHAVVLGPISGSDSHYEFEADDDLFQRPADEIVEAFMAHIHREGVIKHEFGYELNSAHKNKEKRVVTAIGNLLLDGDELPFTAMISVD